MEPLDGDVPLEKIMKSCSFQLEPVSLNAAVTSSANAFKLMLRGNEKRSLTRGHLNRSTGRKFKVQIKAEWA